MNETREALERLFRPHERFYAPYEVMEVRDELRRALASDFDGVREWLDEYIPPGGEA